MSNIRGWTSLDGDSLPGQYKDRTQLRSSGRFSGRSDSFRGVGRVSRKQSEDASLGRRLPELCSWASSEGQLCAARHGAAKAIDSRRLRFVLRTTQLRSDLPERLKTKRRMGICTNPLWISRGGFDGAPKIDFLTVRRSGTPGYQPRRRASDATAPLARGALGAPEQTASTLSL